MNKYIYTEINRIEYPHKYMYTEYNGQSFIDEYFKDRKKNIFTIKSQKKYTDNYEYLYEKAKLFLEKDINPLQNKSLTSEINTEDFIREGEITTHKLLSKVLQIYFDDRANIESKLIKNWVDFIVQRFEVTKKIYETYASKDFRSGKGKNDIPSLYALFSLLLTVAYSRTCNLKYLSTLMKVNDLLCSLGDDQKNLISSEGLAFILSSEINFLKDLCKDKIEASSDY